MGQTMLAPAHIPVLAEEAIKAAFFDLKTVKVNLFKTEIERTPHIEEKIRADMYDLVNQ